MCGVQHPYQNRNNHDNYKGRESSPNEFKFEEDLERELKRMNIFLEFDSSYSYQKIGNKIVISQAFNRNALLSKISSKTSSNEGIEDVDGPYLVIDFENHTLESDYLGIQPLFYSTNEMKITEMPEEGMLQVEPQKRIIFKENKTEKEKIDREKIDKTDKGKIEFEDRAVPRGKIAKITKIGKSPEENACEKEIAQTLAILLENAVSERLKNISYGEKVGLMLSGGVDSSTLAVMLSKLGVKFTAYTVCSGSSGSGAKSLDLEYARHLTSSLDIPHEEVVVEKNALDNKMRDILKVIRLKEYRRSTPVFLPVISGLAALYYFAFARASSQGVKWMFSGVGSEEIFAGFVDRTKEDLNLQCKRRLHTIYHRDLYRDFAIAKHFGIKTVAPFLDIDFSYYALEIPSSLKVCKGYKKYIWRCASEIIGTPKKNCWRQNKATQYGSGIDKLVEIIAKESGLGYRKKYIEWLMQDKELPSKNIEIRVVNLTQDWADLKRLVHQVLHEHGFDFKTSRVKEEICNIPRWYLDGGTFLVAICNNRCIGTLGLRKINEKECILENMYIQKHFRGKGLGIRLLNSSIDFAREKGFKKMHVVVHDKYRKGKRFFENRGFLKICRGKSEDIYQQELR